MTQSSLFDATATAAPEPHHCEDGSHCSYCLANGLPDGRRWNGLAFVPAGGEAPPPAKAKPEWVAKIEEKQQRGAREVLGVRPGATAEEIRAAYHGQDWDRITEAEKRRIHAAYASLRK